MIELQLHYQIILACCCDSDSVRRGINNITSYKSFIMAIFPEKSTRYLKKLKYSDYSLPDNYSFFGVEN